MVKRYAGHPTALVFEDVDGKPGKKKVEQLLWGDAIDMRKETHEDFVKVRVRTGEGNKRILGWMKADTVQMKPVLEVTFIDIGQGDGCVVIMPDRKKIVIDAGQGDNMMRYLRWRLSFPSEGRKAKLHAAVISHPDMDHYLGFESIFEMEGVTFDTVYHNGLVERKGKETLGPLSGGKPRMYTGLVESLDELENVLAADAKDPRRKRYPDMLRAGLAAGKFSDFRMLSRADEYMPGFEADKKVSIQVLGPVIETNDSGDVGLRKLGGNGVTKNGHSVVLRLTYGNVRVLLGGDLNIPSEQLLLESLLGREIPSTKAERDAFMEEARSHIEVDIAKSCHHGSADFSSLFLEAVHPVATVISSGDAEPHSHPRAETLGAIGVCSRGERPLIYSTELARSVKESIRNAREVRADLKRLYREVVAETDKGKRRELDAKFRGQIDETIDRTVQTYGAIYLRTDGERAVIGHKFESNSPSKMWDLCQLDPDENGRLHFESPHATH